MKPVSLGNRICILKQGQHLPAQMPLSLPPIQMKEKWNEQTQLHFEIKEKIKSNKKTRKKQTLSDQI